MTEPSAKETCIECGNTWPVTTTAEAREQRERMRSVHPGQRCHTANRLIGPELSIPDGEAPGNGTLQDR